MSTEIKSASEQKKEDWMNSKWRPMMGWTYMITCIFDFVVAPILWSLTQSLFHGSVQTQWQPLTLQGAGLYHIAMGAVLGIAAYGRTQEKLGGANNGGMQFPQGAGTTYVPPGQGKVNVSNQPGMGGGFGNGTTTGFAGGAPAYGAPATGGFGAAGGFGSPAPTWGTNPGAASGFGSVSPGYGAVPPATGQVVVGFGGKKAPPPQFDPEI